MAVIAQIAKRRRLIAGVVIINLALGWAAMPQAAAANQAPHLVQATTGDGHDAPYLRFGLLALLGLALSSGAIVQYRSTATAPPYQPKPRPPKQQRQTTTAISPEPASPAGPLHGADQPAPQIVDPSKLPDAPILLANFRQDRPVAPPPIPRSPAEQACEQAIAAAQRYDRRTTLAQFNDALTYDPAVKPSTVTNFWEMPSGGHVDLALAYLHQGLPLDARSVITMALLIFPHNRELEALLREIAPARLEVSA